MGDKLTPSQIQARKEHNAKLLSEPVKPPADYTLSGSINPRGIVTIPRRLPFVVRQLASLGLLICYPFWFVLVLFWWLIGRLWYGFLWVLFIPVRMSYKQSNPEEYAANKEKGKGVKHGVFLEEIRPDGTVRSYADDGPYLLWIPPEDENQPAEPAEPADGADKADRVAQPPPAGTK